MTLDITITPLYRVDGRDQTSLPGLMAAVPPRKVARGRDQDRVIVYLQLAGNAVLSSGESIQSASRAASAFFNTPGTVTAALRSASESIHSPLHARNLSSPARGQYAVGMLALVAIRESQLTLLLSGPLHAFVLASDGARHISDTLSGRGLGLGEVPPHYFSQISLQPNDRLMLCSKIPPAWESALQDASPASLESTRRRFMTLTSDDLNAVLLQATDGTGLLTVRRLPTEAKPAPSAAQTPAPPAELEAGASSGSVVPEQAGSVQAFTPESANRVLTSPESDPDSPPHPRPVSSRAPEPSAYAIPAEHKDRLETPEPRMDPGLLASLPRGRGSEMPTPAPVVAVPEMGAARARRGARSERARQAARSMAGAIQASRQGSELIKSGLRRFLPRLLPGAEQNPWFVSSPAMMFIALLVPLVVVTVASAVYFRYGRSVQYEQYLVQAQDAQQQALSLADAAAQREAWQRELFYLDKADAYNTTTDTRALRTRAQSSLDQLQAIVRLQFQPVLAGGVGAQIGRLVASENDLYMLDAQRGAILHIALLSSGFQADGAFNCAPGSYGAYTVGPLVDLYALPPTNSLNAAVLGMDAAGNLLYCAPGQVAQAVPLPPPDTNWGRVKAFTLDGGNLYVMDAQSHAVWVYVGKDGTFVDRPYFFFGGQIPQLDDAIDLAVNGDDLYILHSDGHLSTCSYSHIDAVPTRCVDPAPLVNPFPAYRDVDLFSQAHFTQMMFTPAPDAALLVLDSDSQGVFKLAPRTLELESQLRPSAGQANPLPPGAVSALTVGPNHVLYFALKDRIYFAADSP
jgi:hypothetical protein